MKEKEETDVSEQVGVSRFPVPHAAGREAGEALRRWTARVFIQRPSSGVKGLPPFFPRFPQRSAFLFHPAAAFPLSLQHHSLERGFVINISDVRADAGAAPESPE